MVTVGKDDFGRPIGKLLKPEAYFETYNDAYAALVEYNKDPADLDKDITMKELYERWSEEYFKRVKETTKRSAEAAWRYCSEIYREPVRELRVRHFKHLLEHAKVTLKDGTVKEASPVTKERIKSVMNLIFDYAVEYELVPHNYARDFEISGEIIQEMLNATNTHISFTDEEMSILWDNSDHVPYVDIILIQCYSGWRPQELGLILREQTDIEQWIFRGGMKTRAGIDRIVPIHSRIQNFVKKHYEESVKLDSEYLFNVPKESPTERTIRLTYDKYKYRFEKVIEALKLNPAHRAHDPRKHFVTMAKKAKVDEYVIKKLVGHNVSDITEAVYTDRDIEWIRSELEKIP